jgi:hypothetical protein
MGEQIHQTLLIFPALPWALVSLSAEWEESSPPFILCVGGPREWMGAH